MLLKEAIHRREVGEAQGLWVQKRGAAKCTGVGHRHSYSSPSAVCECPWPVKPCSWQLGIQKWLQALVL